MSIVTRSWGIRSFALVVLASFQCDLRSEDHHTFRFSGSIYSMSGPCIAMSPRSDEFLFCSGNDKVQLIRIVDGEMSEFCDSKAAAIAYSADGSRVLVKTDRESRLIETGSKRELPLNKDYLPGGLGITLEGKNGKILIQKLLPGGPAAASGNIQVGDEITGFSRGLYGEKISLLGTSVNEVINYIKGLPGSFIRLNLVSKGEEDEHRVLLRRRGYRMEGSTLVFVDDPIRQPENFILINTKDGLAFASALDGFIYKGPVPETVKTLQQHAISKDQKQFAILGPTSFGPTDYSIEVFDAVHMTRLYDEPFPLSSFSAMRYSPDGKLIFISSQIRVDAFDSVTGKFSHGYTLDGKRRTTIEDINIAAPPEPLALAMAVSEHLLATTDFEGNVKIWSLETGAVLNRYSAKERKVVKLVEFTPDGKWLVFYRDGTLHVVEVADLI